MGRTRIAFAFMCLATVARGQGEPARSPAPDLAREHSPTHVLYRLRQPGTPSVHEELARAAGGSVARAPWPGLIHEIVLSGDSDLATALTRLNGDTRVLYAEADFIQHLVLTPNDPGYGAQYGWPIIAAPSAWDVQTAAANTIVGVIDTGSDVDHEDLIANLWNNPGETPANGIDDDGNGWIDDVHGIDAVNNDGNPDDDHGHGTHTAGTVGAETDNGKGVAGACWDVQLMPLKFLDAGGSGSTSDAITCIYYAVDNGAHLTTNSWGGGGYSQSLKDAIDAAGAAGQLFICAAGNSGTDNDASPFYPASYRSLNLIAVAATDSADNRASFSNYGTFSVDLGAPGVDIYSTWIGNSYTYLSGTSMATPHVAGVAAMLYERSTHKDPNLIKGALLESVDPIPSLQGITVSGGRLNYRAAIDALDQTNLLPATGILFSLKNSATLGGISFDKGDVGHLDPVTGIYSMVFDLSDVHFAAGNVDAVELLADGSLLLSFASREKIEEISGDPGNNVVEDEDLVRFIPGSLGETTTGRFEFYFDGSDVGLDTDWEDIDALSIDASGNLLMSFRGAFTIGSLTGKDEDVVIFAPTTLGSGTSGSFAMYFDGSDVGMADNGEDIDALDLTSAGHLIVSTSGSFSVDGGVTGDDEDLLEFTPTSLGDTTAGTFTLGLDGSLYGLAAADLDAVQILE